MSGGPEQTNILEKINLYLENLDGIDEYVIVLEGFPIYWSNNIDSNRAEELAALAIDITLNTTKFIGDRKSSIVLLYMDGRYIAVAGINNVVLLVKGIESIVTKAVENIIRALSGNSIKCRWCGYDLTLNIIKCPNNHKLPMNMKACPLCGRQISYIKCPKCKNPISASGNRIIIKRPITKLIAGLIMGIGSLAAILLGISVSTHNFLVSAVLLVVGGLLASIAYSELTTKIFIEETK